jgi:CDP-diacylglycerol--serine O-phosphatidyltransferase
MKINRAVFPSIFTILNLFCGFLSVISSVNENWVAATWYIIIAAIFDTLDGRVARWMKGYSKFGIEFDSIADVVSFCFAPSFLIYQAYFNQLSHDPIFEGIPVYWDQFGLLISFMPLLFGGIRLARFNVSAGFDKDMFTGFPTPASAITIGSFILFNITIFDGELRLGVYLIPLALIVSLLNVSKIKYDTMPKFLLKSGTWNQVKLLVLMVLLVIFVFFPGETLFPISIAFILFGIVRAIVHYFSKPAMEDDPNETKIAEV